jgi:hypothetical protein
MATAGFSLLRPALADCDFWSLVTAARLEPVHL